MALHSTTDAQIAALRTLLQGGLNAILTPTTTEDVVVATYGWPCFGQTGSVLIPQGAFPALAIWRESGTATETNRGLEYEDVFRIDYVSSATTLALIDTRWPLLHNVWRAALALVRAGHHVDVDGDADILEDAGFTEIVFDQRYPSVQYLTPVANEAVYPAFRASVKAIHRDAVSIADLADATLHTEVYPDGLPADERDDFDVSDPTFAAEIHD